MTVSNQQVRVSYLGDGTSVQFPIPYPFYLDTDITVMIGAVVQASGYSITGGEDANGNPNTGTVIFSSAPSSGVTVQFILDVPLTQLVKLVDGTEFPSSTLNQVNDRVVQALLRVSDLMDRSIVAPDGDVSPQLALPSASVRAGTYLVFDNNGNLSIALTLPSGTLSGPAVFNVVNATVSSTPGAGNLGMGYQALANNGSGGAPGNNNTAFGYKALRALLGGITNPTGNTAVGYVALQNSNGATNTAIGDNTMANDLTGTDNTAVGAQALFSETASTGNNCFGFQCGYYITTGSSNLLLGNYAGGGIDGPGSGAGLTTGSNNTGIGGGTLANLGTGSFNVALGLGALGSCINGNSNLALGYFAGAHANSASEFYVDNQDRGSNDAEKANALMYGNFGNVAAVNRLRINAQLTASVGTLCSPDPAPTIASAGGIAPTAAITFVSGTATVINIVQPNWMNNGGRITLIPTGLWTWTATGNIALAGIAVVGKALDFIWDGGTGKWYPSYIA